MSALPRDLRCLSSLAWPAASLLLLVGCGGGKRQGNAAATADSVATPPAAAPSPADAAAMRDTTARPDSVGRPSADAGQRAAPSKPTPAPSKLTPAPVPGSKPASAGAGTSAGRTAAADAPLRDAYHRAPRDTVTQQVYDGWKQFNLNCARCHGEDVTGTTIAPHLIVSLKPGGPINSKELFISTVCSGRPAKGMPAWCSLGLEMDKIQDIYSYVKGRSDGKIAPGRPAVRSQG
jgi:mono/diheme cytochrome c family protein